MKNHILSSVLSVLLIKLCWLHKTLPFSGIHSFIFWKPQQPSKSSKDQPGWAGKWQAHGTTTSEPGFESVPILTGEEADVPPIHFTELSVWTFCFSFPNSANFQNHFDFVGVALAFPNNKHSDADKSFKCFYSSILLQFVCLTLHAFCSLWTNAPFSFCWS